SRAAALSDGPFLHSAKGSGRLQSCLDGSESRGLAEKPLLSPGLYGFYAGFAARNRGGTRIDGVSETPKIGILAVQGNVREHAAVFRRLGADPVEVRKPEQV